MAPWLRTRVYDTDDPTYRLWTMVQMVGVLILASGVPRIAQVDFTTVTLVTVRWLHRHVARGQAPLGWPGVLRRSSLQLWLPQWGPV